MSLLAAARSIAAEAAQRGREIEQLRRLPPDLAQKIAAAGLFRAGLPRALGGAELDAADFLELIEVMATGDGATGWCLMIGATAALTGAYLEPVAAEAIFRDPEAIMAGIFAPMGVASPAEDNGVTGYRVSGRWAWASGAQHSRVIFAGCRAPGEEGSLMLALPTETVTFHDTWHSFGLCGTGSLDFSVENLFVPAAHGVALASAQAKYDLSLYRLPIFGLLAAGIAAVSLGLGKQALGAFAGLAQSKKPAGSTRSLAERPNVQAAVAETQGRLGALRGALFAALDKAQSGAVADRLALRLAAAQTAQAMPEMILRLHALAGGSDAYLSSPLQRAMRDAMVASQHMMVSPALIELAGRQALGLPVDATLL